MDVNPVQCLACSRLDRSTVVPVRCEAFPDGIPAAIGTDGADHRIPRGGERDGLVFDLLDADAFDWWQRTYG